MYKSKLQHGIYYHIFNRGNNRESIFKEEKNYQYFLSLYKKYIHPMANLYAYCLMPTHFHFLLQIKEIVDIDVMYSDEKSLWMQFRRFLGTYTKAINKMYQRSGHLFAGRYSRLCVMEDNHFFELISYIHQNPQNHGIVSHYKYWPFSSFHAYKRRDRTSMLARDIFLDDNLYTTIMDIHDVRILTQDIIMQ